MQFNFTKVPKIIELNYQEFSIVDLSERILVPDHEQSICFTLPAIVLYTCSLATLVMAEAQLAQVVK